MCPRMQKEYKIGIRGLIIKQVVSVSRIRKRQTFRGKNKVFIPGVQNSFLKMKGAQRREMTSLHRITSD